MSVEGKIGIEDPQLPSGYTRRQAIGTGVKFLTVMGATLMLSESGQILQVIFPDPITKTPETIHNSDIVLTAEQLKFGVNLVVFGDSIPDGFQGYTDDGNGNRIEKPTTSFANFMGEAVARSGKGRLNVDVRAQPGATGEDIYNQVIEYHNQVNEGKKQGTYRKRPTLFVFSMNGNSYREIMSDPSIYAQAKNIDEQGFLHPEILNLIPPFTKVEGLDEQYAFRSFLEMIQMAQEGLDIAGLIVLGPYDFGKIPSMEFIPKPSEDEKKKGVNVPITDFNLFKDENARKGAHLVSLAVNKSLVEAVNTLNRFPSYFPVKFVSMEGLEEHNNGTEHLDAYGCYLLSCLVMNNLLLQIKFGRKVNLFSEIDPNPPLPEIEQHTFSPSI